MDHDPGACQATFVEIAFGVNGLWVVFENVRDIFRNYLSKKLDLKVAELSTLERGHEQMFKNCVADVKIFKARNDFWQERALIWAKYFAFVAAIACVIVVYFDLPWKIGKFSVLLIAPLPIYAVVSLCVFGWFWWQMSSKGRRFKKFIGEFDKCPAQIKSTLDGLAAGLKPGNTEGTQDPEN